MAWYEPEVMCKKHPNQRQQPGFCLSCLNERLSKLPNFTFNIPPSRSSSSVSSSPAFNSSESSSANGSPKHHHRKISSLEFHHGNDSNGGVMRKSKSITHVSRRRSSGKNNSSGHGKKKQGFWSKLLRSTSSKHKRADLMHENHAEDLSLHPRSRSSFDKTVVAGRFGRSTGLNPGETF